MSRMTLIYSLFECVILIFCFLNYKKSFSFKKLFLLAIVSTGFAMYLGGECPISFLIELENSGQNLTKIVLRLICIILKLYVFALIKKNKSQMSDEIYKYFKFYIIIRLIMDCKGFIRYELLSRVVISLSCALRILANYCILKIMVIELIANPKKILYRNLDNKSKELKNANKKLIKANYEVQIAYEKYERIIECIPCSVVIFNEKGIEYVNSETLKIFKCKKEDELIGSTILDITHSDSHGLIRKKYNAMKKSECYSMSGEYVLHYNNVEFDGEIITLKLKDFGENKCLCLIKNISDNIELKKVEKMLEKKNEEERIKNEILANISHEFKTPVNVIYSAVQIQELKKSTGDIDGIFKYNEVIKQNCNRLTRLINNFIDTIRFQKGGIKADLNYLNIVDLVENITMSVVSFAKSNRISITFDTTDEEIIVLGDNQLIDRVILNLLSNSIKYSKEDGHIDVSVIGHEDEVIITVEDDGIGINKENLNIIFDKLERVDKTLSRRTEGSGLGLSIVKEIMEIHNGTVKVISVENNGTEVILKMPRYYKHKDGIFKDSNFIDKSNFIKHEMEIEMSDIYI